MFLKTRSGGAKASYLFIDWFIYLGKCFLFNWKESVVFSISAKRLSWVKCFRHSTLAHLQHIHHRIPNCALKGIIDMNVKPLHRFPWNDQGYWCWLFKLQEWQSAKFICENTQKSSSVLPNRQVDEYTSNWKNWNHKLRCSYRINWYVIILEKKKSCCCIFARWAKCSWSDSGIVSYLYRYIHKTNTIMPIKNAETPLLLSNIIGGFRSLRQFICTVTYRIKCETLSWPTTRSFSVCKHIANLLSILIRFSFTLSSATIPTKGLLLSKPCCQPNGLVVKWTEGWKKQQDMRLSPYSLPLARFIHSNPREPWMIMGNGSPDQSLPPVETHTH